MRWRVGSAAVIAGCLSWGGAVAQSTGDLDRIEAAIQSGALDGIREALERWHDAANGVDPETAGRVRFLRGRLMTDADSARSEYLAVAIDGRSSYGALAWLRLAQLDLSAGQPARAIEHLTRLQTDYPNARTADAWYWRARAFESGGRLEDACEAFDRALEEAGGSADGAIGEQASERRRGCAPGGLRFTLQIGAFSAETAAESLASTARALGFPARIVEDEGLDKVRVGLFASPDSARLLERRLREDGFSVAIVAAES